MPQYNSTGRLRFLSGDVQRSVGKGRLISAQAEISSESIKKGQLEPYEWQQLNSKIVPLSDAPIFIDDTPPLSVLNFVPSAEDLLLKRKYNSSSLIIYN